MSTATTERGAPRLRTLTSDWGGNTIPAMKIVELRNVTRKQTLLYYRKEFEAEAVMDIMAKQLTFPIEFVLESTALGTVEVHVSVAKAIEYPLVPIVSELRRYIRELHKTGSLP